MLRNGLHAGIEQQHIIADALPHHAENNHVKKGIRQRGPGFVPCAEADRLHNDLDDTRLRTSIKPQQEQTTVTESTAGKKLAVLKSGEHEALGH